MTFLCQDLNRLLKQHTSLKCLRLQEAFRLTMPAPHIEAGVLPVMPGVELTVAAIAVLDAVVQPLLVPST